MPIEVPPFPGSSTPRDPFYDANEIVRSGWDYYRGLTSSVLADANSAISNMGDVSIEPVVFDGTFTAEFDPGTFTRPTSPGAPPSFGGITTAVPPAPTVAPVVVDTALDLPPAPDVGSFNFSLPSPPTGAPGAPNITLPPLDAVIMPADLVLPDMPPMPTLYELNFPGVVPSTAIAPFDASNRPQLDFDIPNVGFVYNEQAYVADLALQIKSKLSGILNGEFGLPAAIEQALFDRARAREDMLHVKAKQEVYDEFATKGFGEPNGILARRIDEVRQQHRDKTSALNRDITIEQFKERLNDVRDAVAKGIACEQLLIEQNNAVNQRALQVAQISAELAFKLYDARVALFNAQLESFKVDAEVYVQLIRAKEQEIAIYRARIDAEKTKGDVNESLLRSYVELIRARDAMVQVYRTQVDAARAKLEANNQRLEATRTQLAVFSESVRAFGERVNAYRAEVEGSLGGVRVIEALSNSYATHVQAIKSKADLKIEQARVQIAAGDQQVNAYRAAVEGASARIKAESENAALAASNYGARANIFTAEVQAAAAESEAWSRSSQLRVEAERARLEIALKNADMRSTQAIKVAELLLEALRGQASARSQLAASLMNGVNLSANISGGGSTSRSDSTSWNVNLSGEI